MPTNGRRPADCPEWGWVIIQGMREYGREGAEDRKEIRIAISEIRDAVSEIRDAIKETGEHIRLLAEGVQRTSEFVLSQHGHMIQMGEDTKAMRKTLGEILRALRVQGNGRDPHGRGNGRK